MGSIREITGKHGSRYHAQIRVKGFDHKSASFGDKETAEIWCAYHERLLGEMRDFGARDCDVYTVKDALYRKYQNSREYLGTLPYFEPFLDKPLSYLTHEILMERAKECLQMKVRKGGSVHGGNGVYETPSPTTVFRRFSYLSAAINDLSKDGIDVENRVPAVIAWLKTLKKDKE